MNRPTAAVLAAFLLAVAPRVSFALITGGAGNTPIADPGWPQGAAPIFNHPGRIAWWEGPPLGGGEWHAECRGDVKDLNQVLADFAKLDVKVKRVVVHDGAGHSFWLAPNHELNKLAAARIDWSFTVWQPANWEQLRNLPPDLKPTQDGEQSPPSQVDAYTAKLRWADVAVPRGLDVVDERLEAHGFALSDGIVIEGKVTNLSTKEPMAATVRLERVEPQKTGGYHYSTLAEARTDAQGHWVMKQVPPGWVRVVAEADGFVSRVAMHARFDGQPRWQSFDCPLARSAQVEGRVIDDSGKPLADVAVRFHDLAAESGARYDSAADFSMKTDAQGRFRVDGLPVGTARIWVSKPGYCRPGLGLPIRTPKRNVELEMTRSAKVRVTVDFLGKPRPNEYLVSIEHEAGEGIGLYGGSGNINAQNQMVFENVPPGPYVLRGAPNPSSADERTEPITIELKGGETRDVTLKAK